MYLRVHFDYQMKWNKRNEYLTKKKKQDIYYLSF